MKFKLTIDSENAAFADGDGASEVVRILLDVAGKIERGRDGGKVMDVNGNCVGSWDLENENE